MLPNAQTYQYLLQVLAGVPSSLSEDILFLDFVNDISKSGDYRV